MKRDVFISYSRKNMERVMEIKRQIDAQCGTDCWIDLKGIESGSEMFLKDIVGGIDACEVFLFMLSKESMESEYALLELNYAKEMKKNVVLVNIDDCHMTGVFLFKYSLTDTIAWNNTTQREKLLRDVVRWISSCIYSLDEVEEFIKQLDKKVGELERFEDSDGKCGYKDENDCVVIPSQWNDAWPFTEGLAMVKNNCGKRGFIDKSGRLVIPCQWIDAMPFREGLAAVEDSNSKWGYLDKSGCMVIPCQWSDEWSFSEGLAPVEDSTGKQGYIDKNGRVVIPCQWRYADWFREDLACVKDSSNKWGFIDKRGSVVIPCQWYSVRAFNKGISIVKDGKGKEWKIDKTGKVVGEA